MKLTTRCHMRGVQRIEMPVSALTGCLSDGTHLSEGESEFGNHWILRSECCSQISHRCSSRLFAFPRLFAQDGNISSVG